MICNKCGHDNNKQVATKISIYGMYDAHVFDELSGSTLEEIIKNWRQLEHPIYGKTMLCPIIVLDDEDKELRRVGPLIKEGGNPAEWLKVAKADEDVVRLLATTS